jgi:hypothetical protein
MAEDQMKANERVLEQILHSGDQYIIPLFQRYYEWKPDNWERLWADLDDLTEEGSAKRHHFLGSVVCVADSHEPGVVHRYLVIDGQQRILTLAILLCLVRDLAAQQGQEDLAAEIEDNFLLHRHKKDNERYKVIPRQRDRSSFLNLVDRKPAGERTRVVEAYEFFKRSVSSGAAAEGRLRQLFTAVSERLMLVVITLDPHENPFAIFKSLNSTGLKLAEADLIRNHVFMHIPLMEQDQFEDIHWRPLEDTLSKTASHEAIDITTFFRDYLMREGRYVREDGAYVAFEAEVDARKLDPKDLCAELLRFAKHYNVVRGRVVAPTPEIDGALAQLRQLNVSTTYPLALALLGRHELGKMPAADVAKAFRAIAGFVLRRFICGESSRGYSRWFPSACRELGDAPLANLVKFLKDKGWPDDGRLATAVLRYNLYHSKYARAVLEGMERRIQRSEAVDLSTSTIEHVMPQTINDDEDGLKWKAALGPEWKRIYDSWLDTIGNLTLVGYDYNILMRNKPFGEKKQELLRSKVYLNEHFVPLSEWSENLIMLRGEALAKQLVTIWDGPA